MPTVKTIKPAGGGDYTTLASWEDFADGEATADQWAECYDGGSLGSVVFASWTASPSAGAYPRIYVAEGTGHAGNQVVGAFIANPTDTAAVACGGLAYIRVEGLRLLLGTGSGKHGVASVGVNAVIDGLLVVAGGANQYCLFLNSGTNVRISNNILLGSLSTQGAALLFGGTTSFLLENNTAAGGGYGFYFYAPGGANVTVTAKNNVSIGHSVGDFYQTVAGTLNVTASSNASEDATADDFGGTGNLTGIVPADEFTDPANDFTLLPTSQLIDAGADVSGDGVTTDILGTARPQGAAFDIGAFEFIPVPVATISRSPATLDFAAVAGGANPASQTFDVENNGDVGSTLSVSITDDADWLTVAPTSVEIEEGAPAEEFVVSVDIDGLDPGEYEATITITDEDASNSPQTIAVTLTVSAQGAVYRRAVYPTEVFDGTVFSPDVYGPEFE